MRGARKKKPATSPFLYLPGLCASVRMVNRCLLSIAYDDRSVYLILTIVVGAQKIKHVCTARAGCMRMKMRHPVGVSISLLFISQHMLDGRDLLPHEACFFSLMERVTFNVLEVFAR